jgi:hypothetical protein
MLTEPTIEKLRSIRPGTMADAWIKQREEPKIHELDFDSRFGFIVDAEHLAREQANRSRAPRSSASRTRQSSAWRGIFAGRGTITTSATR